MEANKFEVNENVVITFPCSSTSSGKVLRVLGDDTYQCLYIWNGWKIGRFTADQLTSFGTAKFLCIETYAANTAEAS